MWKVVTDGYFKVLYLCSYIVLYVLFFLVFVFLYILSITRYVHTLEWKSSLGQILKFKQINQKVVTDLRLAIFSSTAIFLKAVSIKV